jgi:hypothetical protein
VTAVSRGLRAFGRFWWDFLVGDTPELTLTALVIVGAAFALAPHRDVALVVLPAVAVAALVVSAARGRTKR